MAFVVDDFHFHQVRRAALLGLEVNPLLAFQAGGCVLDGADGPNGRHFRHAPAVDHLDIEFTLQALDHHAGAGGSADDHALQPGQLAARLIEILEQTQPVIFIPLDSSSSSDNMDGDNSSLAETMHDPTELNAFDHLENRERVELLRCLIKELPTQSQKILMLYYIEELRLSEIAEVFSLSEGRISQIISHSIISLRAKFQTSESI